MKPFVVFAVALSLSIPAAAQQPPPQSVDPRLAAPIAHALQAEVALRDAALQAMQEDAGTRERQWREWVKAWCGETQGCAVVAKSE
jgi:hypothetical protein